MVLSREGVNGMVLDEYLRRFLRIARCLESHRFGLGGGDNRHWGKNSNWKILQEIKVWKVGTKFNV